MAERAPFRHRSIERRHRRSSSIAGLVLVHSNSPFLDDPELSHRVFAREGVYQRSNYFQKIIRGRLPRQTQHCNARKLVRFK